MRFKFWYIIIVLVAALVVSEYLKLDRPGRFLSPEENAVIEYYNTLVNANQNSTLYFINIETRISNTKNGCRLPNLYPHYHNVGPVSHGPV